MILNRFALFCVSAAAHYVCYDNDGEPGSDPGQSGGGDGGGGSKTFTQEDVNKFLAEDRRKHGQRMQAMEAKLTEALSKSQMTDQERAELETTIDDLRKQFTTKEQQALTEAKKAEAAYKRQIEEWSQKATTYEKKYVDSSIHRSLVDAAASNDAFSADQIVALLKPFTKLVNDAPVVDFQDRHAETGEPIIVQMSPTEAVKRMRDLPETYGNLFKSNVMNGLGANNAGGHKKIDPSKLSYEQYAKLRKENPSALGM